MGKTLQLSHLEQSDNLCFVQVLNFWFVQKGVVGGGWSSPTKSGHTYCKCSKNSKGLHMVFASVGGAFDL